MKIASNDSILKLIHGAGFPRVSIYLPTHRGGQEKLQDPIRLKNLARDARKALVRVNVNEEEADRLLRPLQNLAADTSFLKHLADGLAILLSADGMRHFHIPYPVREQVVVSDAFHLRPLLPLIGANNRFFVLALNKNHIGLYEANRYSMHGVKIEDMPLSLAEALRFDDGETQLQYHIAGPTAATSSGRTSTKPIAANAAVVHGHGGEKDIHHDQLLRFFREVDKGLHDYLRDRKAPLVLAGVDYYFPIYRQVNSYAHLFDKGVTGSTEGMSARELHNRAWALLSEEIEKEEEEVIGRFNQLAANGGGSRTASELAKIVPAAFEGRIESLLVPEDAQHWGDFDETSLEVGTASQDGRQKELYDYASLKTLQNGGTLYLLPKAKMPGGAPVAAILRYATGVIERGATRV